MSAFWSTVSHGLRRSARQAPRLFSLPDRRPATVAAVVLATVVLGAFGAAAGSWLGAGTLADLPAGTAVTELSRQAAGVDAAVHVTHETSPWTSAKVTTAVSLDASWDATQARQRYATAGWSVSELVVVHDRASVLDPATRTGTYIPTRYDRFTAESHGLVIEISGMSVGDESTVQLVGWPASSPMLRILAVTGVALGLIIGWLLAAAVARRVRPTHPAHRVTMAALTAATVLVLATPAFALYGNLLRALRPHEDRSGPVGTVHSALLPDSYWPAAPAWLLPTLSAVGGVLAAVTLTLAVWPRSTRTDAANDSAAGDFAVATSAVEASIAAARVDRDAAQRLLFLAAYPDWTPDALNRMRDRLTAAGVPADFLTTTQPSGPSRY
ncbi:hypothetical protein ACIBSS_28010 [Micromonospora aurantiaca]|uniref:hypothetical protein n=1 Tax=Micromonospora aurantiaca (nom. illeg.) TaxID=47850 RepID=UPI0037A467F0